MPAPATTDEFLDLVRKSGVVDEKRLDAYLAKVRAAGAVPPEPAKFAGLLVRDGMLTHFQAEQFLQGKWRRFTIGKYKVLERLGAGGMGSVYLCEHKLMRRRVAVKVLPDRQGRRPRRRWSASTARPAPSPPSTTPTSSAPTTSTRTTSCTSSSWSTWTAPACRTSSRRPGRWTCSAPAHYIRQAAARPAARPRDGRPGPPRHQAGQHPRRPQRHRQDPRHGPGPLLPRRGRHPHQEVRRERPGHGRLPRPGAGARQPRRRHPGRHLQPRAPRSTSA